MSLFELEHTFTVAELGRLVHEVLDVTFPTDVWVQGEVRGIRRPSSGHVYFDIVDPSPVPGRPPDAVMSVVLFKATRDVVNTQIRRSGGGMRIDDGVSVRVRGVPDFYPPHGRLQLRMTGIDPAYTLGELVAARDRLMRVLADEALLGRNAALAFPVTPLRVGLVTAAGSAAHADFVHELSRSSFAFEIVLASTPVQGVGAAARVCAAIDACLGRGVEVIAVVRGGGARTDLVVFDDEAVARAIASSPVPVITGIGHEIDTSVADLVAHRTLKTPTACAALLVDRVLEAERRSGALWQAIAATATHRLERRRDHLTAVSGTLGRRARASLRDADRRTLDDARRARELVGIQLTRSGERLGRDAQALALSARHRLRGAGDAVDRGQVRLARRAPRALDDARDELDHVEQRVRLLDPARVLARGWSITTRDDGTVVRAPGDVAAGDTIVTRLARGSVTSTVAGTAAGGRTDHRAADAALDHTAANAAPDDTAEGDRP